MCLIVFAWNSHPDYRLILAANRDEAHTRPTKEAHWWPDQPAVLAGRDLQAGGTWLGMSRSGRFAAVTNYREGQRGKAAARSRGQLVNDFLQTDVAPVEYSQTLDGVNYAGFSLLTADRNSMACVSNRGEQAETLAPGIYGLSNAALDTPWPKLTQSKQALQSLLDGGDVNTTQLLNLLSDRSTAAVGDIHDDGLPFDLARSLSAVFIVTPQYGTRCSTAVLLRHDGRVEFVERSFTSDGEPNGSRSFNFQESAENTE
jgi:uncharacterized protein with NRDE domain